VQVVEVLMGDEHDIDAVGHTGPDRAPHRAQVGQAIGQDGVREDAQAGHLDEDGGVAPPR